MEDLSTFVQGPAPADPTKDTLERSAQFRTLKAGQLIFSGGVTAPVPVVLGGSATLEFDGLGAIDVYGA